MDVVVCHVHATCVQELTIYYGYLVVVAVEEVVYPWELHLVVGIDLDTPGTVNVEERVLQGKVAVRVAEIIVYHPDLHPLLRLTSQEVEELAAYTVLLELEIVEVDIPLGILDFAEKVGILQLARWQDDYAIIGIDWNAHLPEVTDGG